MKILRVILNTVFEVENPMQSKKEKMLVQRVLPYRFTAWTETYFVELTDYAKHATQSCNIIDKILDIRSPEAIFETVIKELCFEHADKNWEPLKRLIEEAAEEVRDFSHTP